MLKANATKLNAKVVQISKVLLLARALVVQISRILVAEDKIVLEP
jgi:hypothetical protein